MPNLNSIHKLFALLCFALALGACDTKVPTMPVQTWKGMTFSVETRPPKLGVGMNEFLVVASKVSNNNSPAHDLIVYLSIEGTHHWEEAIQDGFVGVYRRAVRVFDPAHDVLLLKIVHGKDTGILRFPLNQQH